MHAKLAEEGEVGKEGPRAGGEEEPVIDPHYLRGSLRGEVPIYISVHHIIGLEVK